MSSMFLYGPNRLARFDDFRARVHDSDGLLVHTAADEWIWRPLGNGPDVQVTSFPGRTPRGFGLVQRARRFADYLDAEAGYHRRPSEWIVPLDGDWDGGRVELLEYAVGSEFNDNIAAYWVPDEPFGAGDARRYRYRIRMFDDRLPDRTLAAVERTRIGWDALPGAHAPPPRSRRRFVVDFSGSLSAPGGGGQAAAPPPIGVLETSTGEVSDLVVHPLPEDAGWRASFRLAPAGREPAQLRLYLVRDDRRVSETWSYVWHPDHVQE